MLLLVVTAHIFLLALILFRDKRNNLVQWFVSLPFTAILKTDDFSKTEFYMESPSNCDLPADVIQEILLRLPVKSLLRFKCVCKHWYALIGSPDFVNQHFGRESNEERLLIRHYKPNKNRYAFALFVDEMCGVYEEPDHLQMPDAVVALLGPLNGIFCVVSESGRMALLNPAMRQVMPLPLPYPGVRLSVSIYDHVVGFGLDPLSGHYKLVSFQCLWDEEMNVSLSPPLVSIYNSGSDSWRHVEDLDLVNPMLFVNWSLGNTFLNGTYYLLMGLENGGDAMLAFDMSSEKFREIQVLDSEDRCDQLALNGDSITLLSYDFSYKTDKCVDVWVMQNEGCWTKSSSFGPSRFTRPLGFWKKNELVLETGDSLLILYNVSTQKLRTVKARRKEDDSHLDWVFSYKESLVSIKGEGNSCKLWDTSSDFVKDFFK